MLQASKVLLSHIIFSIAIVALLISCCCILTCEAFFLSAPSTLSSYTHAIEHLFSPPAAIISLDELTNVRIPGSVGDILAYKAIPTGSNANESSLPSIILIHEFFGLNPSIIDKAQALSNELNCKVIAPDTFRGETTTFIPKAIWLALTTPQERVNEDLDCVCTYLQSENGDRIKNNNKLAVMGFCYGGGKAIRYTTQYRQDAATVIFYGSPVTDVDELKRLKAPVCGIYGKNDAQFSKALLDNFQSALNEANVKNDVRIYEGVGHAFWTDMEQIKRGDEPQTAAYEQCVSFLRNFFDE